MTLRNRRGLVPLLLLLVGGCAFQEAAPESEGGSVNRQDSAQAAPSERPERLAARPFEDTLAVRLSWSPVESATHYEVWRADRGGPVFTFLARTEDTVFLDRGVFPRTDFGYRVRAANDAGVGPYSDSVYVTTAPRPGNR